jgi:tripartite-type tricarboxylate transporter receptor subunit TctC
MTGLLRAVLLMLLIAAPAHAQTSYPQKPVRLIVPFPAGGSNDTLCRIVGEKLSGAWNHSR